MLAGSPASGFRRVAVILIYGFVTTCSLALVATMLISEDCYDQDRCSGLETIASSVVGGAWLILTGLLIVLGWTGRLPGCRPKRTAPQTPRF